MQSDFELSEPFTNITKAQVFEMMRGDREGWQEAARLMLTDDLDVFRDKNPEWPHYDELNRLLYKEEPRSEQEEQRLQELLKMAGLSMEVLRNKLLHTYAHMQGYQIIPEG